MGKSVIFYGTSRSDLKAFPADARRAAGFQIEQVQEGFDPDDWKPMASIGSGVREIRVRDESGAFRVIYIAKFAEAVYVLHCFQKKTEKTEKIDLNLTRMRYREIQKGR